MKTPEIYFYNDGQRLSIVELSDTTDVAIAAAIAAAPDGCDEAEVILQFPRGEYLLGYELKDGKLVPDQYANACVNCTSDLDEDPPYCSKCCAQMDAKADEDARDRAAEDKYDARRDDG